VIFGICLLNILMEKLKQFGFNMNYFEEEKMKAIADPHGLSGDVYPDGTPMTNWERWKELNNPYR